MLLTLSIYELCRGKRSVYYTSVKVKITSVLALQDIFIFTSRW